MSSGPWGPSPPSSATVGASPHDEAHPTRHSSPHPSVRETGDARGPLWSSPPKSHRRGAFRPRSSPACPKRRSAATQFAQNNWRLRRRHAPEAVKGPHPDCWDHCGQNDRRYPNDMYLTDRLHLRPGHRDDAPALLRAIADPDIVRNLASAPWPYGLADAERLASQPFNTQEPRLFIFRDGPEPAELIGVAGLDRMPTGEVELGYWIAKPHWNRGYASEVGRRLIEIARSELKLSRLVAGYFIDNPASGRVLSKLGFVPLPGLVDRNSRARGGAAACQMCSRDL